VKESQSIFLNQTFKGKNLFITIADAFKSKIDTLEAKNKITPQSDAALAMPRFIKNLQNASNSSLFWATKRYENEGHNSAAFISEYDGLHYIFRDWNLLSVDNEIFDTKVKAEVILKKIDEIYKKISKTVGYRVLPSEKLVNDLGYTFLRNNNYKSSYLFFKMNEENFPESFNVYDAYGDYYSVKGESKKAINYYKMALSIHKYGPTVDKLRFLEKVN
jgi:tetratricopeptide (TPR) repeat protein